MALTPGKRHGLDLLSDGGVFEILAVDHRDSLREVMRPDDPGAVPTADLVAFKSELARAVGDGVSGLMLDPEYGIGPGRASEAAGVGYLAALEAQGYLGDPAADATTVLEGWGVREAQEAGAAGLKLLVLHDPVRGGFSGRQAAVVRTVAAEASEVDLPLFVEPLPVPAAKLSLAPYLTTVAAIAGLGADVLKLQLPGATSEAGWAEACARIGEAAGRPWALLSAGVAFDTFCRQLEIACEAGCSGYIAGRAVWGPVAGSGGAEAQRLIGDVVLPRLARLGAIVTRARPWTDYAGL